MLRKRMNASVPDRSSDPFLGPTKANLSIDNYINYVNYIVSFLSC